MKKNVKKFMSALLSATTLLSALTTVTVNAVNESNHTISGNQTFTMYEDEKGIHFVGPTGNEAFSNQDVPTSQEISDTYFSSKKEPSKALSQGKAEGEISESLPDNVDNSQSSYFPKIGDQGQLGSCTFWAQVYYQFTYTMNKEMNRPTTAENTFSPQWSYNVVAGTDEMIGPYYSTYEFMRRQGNVLISQVPYDLNVSSFYPTEDVWKTSTKYRLKKYENLETVGSKDSQITSVDDTDLIQIKTALNNGDVLAYSTHINSWNSTKIKRADNLTENNKYVNEYTVKSMTGKEGGHRMTIVGYNDNIWTDVNDNNVVDNGEMGAFKIANSWGNGYGNKGFIWVAYDALNLVSSVKDVEEDATREQIFSEISRIEVLPYNTNSNLYLKYTLNTSDRTQNVVSVTAEKDGTEFTYGALSNEYTGDKCAYDGSTNASDATMVFLLNNAVNDISSENFHDYNWSVTVKDTKKDGNIFTVKNLEIVDEATNKSYKASNIYPITLDGEEKTVELSHTSLNHAVIYYRGYKNPVINYKTPNGNWIASKGIAMEENIERRGYVHKYVVDLGATDRIMLYFSDDNGNVDNNKGKYFTAYKGLNYYVTENVAEPITVNLTNEFNSVADVDLCSVFDTKVSGGYAPYQYNYLIENLQTGETLAESEYSDNSSYSYYFRNTGEYKVTVNVMDYSNTVVSKSSNITVKEIPFEFTQLTCTPKAHIMVGDEVEFTAITNFEHIRAWGNLYNKYDFTIKRDNQVCYTTNVKSSKYNIGLMTSTVKLLYTPTVAGSYSLTISSTEGKGQYAEKTINFNVAEYNGTIVGDANNNKHITVSDAILIMKYSIRLVDENEIWLPLADCDKNGKVDIKDAICVLRRVVGASNCASAGQVNYREPATEPPTAPATEAPTQPPTKVEENIVTFTNSLNWGGTIYCYYWSDSNKSMTSWPGKAMTASGTNTNGKPIYTFKVPDNVTYVIFTNGSIQTVDIPYKGGEIKYYPTKAISNGKYDVEVW